LLHLVQCRSVAHLCPSVAADNRSQLSCTESCVSDRCFRCLHGDRPVTYIYFRFRSSPRRCWSHNQPLSRTFLRDSRTLPCSSRRPHPPSSPPRSSSKANPPMNAWTFTNRLQTAYTRKKHKFCGLVNRRNKVNARYWPLK